MDSQLLFKQVATTKDIKHACPYVDSSEQIDKSQKQHLNTISNCRNKSTNPLKENSKRKNDTKHYISGREDDTLLLQNTPTNSLNIEIAQMKNDMKQSISSGHNIRQE
jgi:hypothetical protein